MSKSFCCQTKRRSTKPRFNARICAPFSTRLSFSRYHVADGVPLSTWCCLCFCLFVLSLVFYVSVTANVGVPGCWWGITFYPSEFMGQTFGLCLYFPSSLVFHSLNGVCQGIPPRKIIVFLIVSCHSMCFVTVWICKCCLPPLIAHGKVEHQLS